METIFSKLKVNNEYELCEVYDPEAKDRLEKGLLAERISYFMHFPKTGFFSKHKYLCVFCVNETSIEIAEEIARRINEEEGYEMNFLIRRNPTSYL